MDNVFKYHNGYRLFTKPWWSSLFLYRRNLVWAYQRATRGYADCDVWSIDWFLSPVIAGAVRQLKASDIGHPTTITGDYEKAKAKWHAVLDQIADGFDSAQKINDMAWKDEADKKVLEGKFDKGFRLFHKWYFCLWD